LRALSEKEAEELRFWTRNSIYGRRSDERGRPSRRVFKRYLEILAEPATNLDGRTVIDIGCGPMGSLHFFPGALKVGLDPLAVQYHESFGVARHQKMSYVAAYAEKLPLADARADYVFCINAIDHVDEPAAVADEIVRVLKPGGRLILQVDVSKKAPTPTEPHVLSPASVDAMFIPRLVPVGRRLLRRHPWWLRRRFWLTDLVGFYPRFDDTLIASFTKP